MRSINAPMLATSNEQIHVGTFPHRPLPSETYRCDINMQLVGCVAVGLSNLCHTDPTEPWIRPRHQENRPRVCLLDLADESTGVVAKARYIDFRDVFLQYNYFVAAFADQFARFRFFPKRLQRHSALYRFSCLNGERRISRSREFLQMAIDTVLRVRQAVTDKENVPRWRSDC